MADTPVQPSLFPAPSARCDAIVIKDRCVPRIDDDLRVVIAGGLPLTHHTADDRAAAAHAMRPALGVAQRVLGVRIEDSAQRQAVPGAKPSRRSRRGRTPDRDDAGALRRRVAPGTATSRSAAAPRGARSATPGGRKHRHPHEDETALGGTPEYMVEELREMAESFFAELKRYMRFSVEDEAALGAFASHAAPHFGRIADQFYGRLSEHEEAKKVLSGPAQVERLKGTLRDWLKLLFEGPWDEAYYDRRARIGRVHVRIDLPQRFMFGAMDVIRVELIDVAHASLTDHDERLRLVKALHKIIDIELAIMLETYREAFVDKVQLVERMEKVGLEQRLAVSQARYDEIVEKAEALITTADARGYILLFNAQCERLTGLSRAQAVGQEWLELFVRDVDRDSVRARFADVLEGRSAVAYEGPIVRAV